MSYSPDFTDCTLSMMRENSVSEGWISMSCDERIFSGDIQYARGIATGASGRKNSSSIACNKRESESMDSTRSYLVWLNARSLVYESAQVARQPISHILWS